ncbi:acyltransferase [Mariniflexile litorale]|uniref:Acyltransferase n=1 Tax=Mariniflexile litorale TaxID=3045158 RepID=A0AAU7EKM2_9FLAO|nr:acyltransferase [Mariniflexile sp. KMM 9835]MDQ8211338.1 acyltransferase [Mariniflexile sp. KMM 9835]
MGFKTLLKFLYRVHLFFQRKLSHLKLKTLIKDLGKDTTGHWSVEIKYGENISVGNNTTIGPYSTLGAMSQIKIGNYVRISKGVIIETAGLNLNGAPPYKHIAKPIIIEDGVWIATNAIILGGVTIGKNSIIGAGTVITKNIEPNSIIVGQSLKKLEKKTHNK